MSGQKVVVQCTNIPKFYLFLCKRLSMSQYRKWAFFFIDKKLFFFHCDKTFSRFSLSVISVDCSSTGAVGTLFSFLQPNNYVFNIICQHFEIYSRNANKHITIGVYLTINDNSRWAADIHVYNLSDSLTVYQYIHYSSIIE